MSLLQSEAGLIALLLGAVVLGIVVIVAASLARQPHDALQAERRRKTPPRRSDDENIVSQVAARAPTDAHMFLGVLGKALRRLLAP